VVIVAAAVDGLRHAQEKNWRKHVQFGVIMLQARRNQCLHVNVLALHQPCLWRPRKKLVKDDELKLTPGNRTHSAAIVTKRAAFKQPRQEIRGIVLGAQHEPRPRRNEVVGELVGREHVHFGWACELGRGDAIDKRAKQLCQLCRARECVATLLSCEGRPHCLAVKEALDHRIEVARGSQVCEAWIGRATGECLTRRSSGL